MRNILRLLPTVLAGAGGETPPAQPTGLTVTAGASQMALAWADNATNETAYRVYRSTNGVDYAQVGDDLAAEVESYNDTTYSQGTIYYYKVAAVNGAGETLSDASDPAYYFADNFDRADGAIGNGWTADAGWVIASNVAKNTPAAGSDLLTNGTMEAFTGGLADGWAKTGTPTTTQESTIVHGGSSSQKVVATGAQNGVNQTPLPALTIGAWYVAQGYVYPVGSNNITFQVYDSNGFMVSVQTTYDTTWGEFYAVARASGNGANRWIRVINTVGTPTFYVDDVTFKLLTLSTLFATRDTGMSDFDISLNLTNTYYQNARQPGGIVACVDDAATPTNYLHGYYDGANVRLDKVVNGTYSNLISVTVSHVTNAVLRLTKDGTSVSIWYNGTQRGTTQTVSDVSLISNTIHGLSGMHPNTTLNNLVIANPT